MSTSPFAAPLGSPRFRAFAAGGIPLAGGKAYIYQAGTTTADTSYPTYADGLAGTNANTNPVILDANGEAEIFLQAGRLYKVLVQDSTGVQQWVVDSVNPAAGYPQPYTTDWTLYTGAIAFLSSASLQVTGVDVTGTMTAGRRIRTVNTGGTVYATVTAATFSGGNTTLAVVCDTGSLDSGLSALAYGMTSYVNPSYLDPRTELSVIKNGDQTGFASITKVAAWTVEVDALSEWDAVNNRWTCKYPGKYLVQMAAVLTDTGASQNLQLQIFKNGLSGPAASFIVSSAATSALCTGAVMHLLSLSSGSYIEMFVQGTANTTVKASSGTSITVTRIP